MTLLKRLGINVLRQLFKLVDWLTPKNSRQVIFSQNKGRYSDNSRALFEYMSEHCAGFDAIWLANTAAQAKVIAQLNPHYHVVSRYSWHGIIAALTARLAVMSHGSGDFGLFCFSNRTHLVMLWHGVAVKRHGVLDQKNNSRKLIKQCRKETANYHKVIACSEIDAYLASACLGIDAEKVCVTGYPRNDALFSTPHSLQSVWQNNDQAQQLAGKKIVLYAPTFRDVGTTEFFPFADFNKAELEAALDKLDAVLLVRPHPNDNRSRKVLLDIFSGSSVVVLCDNTMLPDLAELLPLVDCIVTDYSSVYIDLLIKDVPCIFIPYDLEHYQQSRGLAYDYNLITPGAKVSSQTDFLTELNLALSGAQHNVSQRNFAKRFFHKYADGNSCQRVANMLASLVK